MSGGNGAACLSRRPCAGRRRHQGRDSFVGETLLKAADAAKAVYKKPATLLLVLLPDTGGSVLSDSNPPVTYLSVTEPLSVHVTLCQSGALCNTAQACMALFMLGSNR